MGEAVVGHAVRAPCWLGNLSRPATLYAAQQPCPVLQMRGIAPVPMCPGAAVMDVEMVPPARSAVSHV